MVVFLVLIEYSVSEVSVGLGYSLPIMGLWGALVRPSPPPNLQGAGRKPLKPLEEARLVDKSV